MDKQEALEHRDSVRALVDNALRFAGGPGSGNFGHAGRPGERGGSASSEHGTAMDDEARRSKDGYGGTKTPDAEDHVTVKGNVRGAGEKGRVTSRHGSFMTVKHEDGTVAHYHSSNLLVDDEDDPDDAKSERDESGGGSIGERERREADEEDARIATVNKAIEKLGESDFNAKQWVGNMSLDDLDRLSKMSATDLKREYAESKGIREGKNSPGKEAREEQKDPEQKDPEAEKQVSVLLPRKAYELLGMDDKLRHGDLQRDHRSSAKHVKLTGTKAQIEEMLGEMRDRSEGHGFDHGYHDKAAFKRAIRSVETDLGSGPSRGEKSADRGANRSAKMQIDAVLFPKNSWDTSHRKEFKEGSSRDAEDHYERLKKELTGRGYKLKEGTPGWKTTQTHVYEDEKGDQIIIDKHYYGVIPGDRAKGYRGTTRVKVEHKPKKITTAEGYEMNEQELRTAEDSYLSALLELEENSVARHVHLSGHVGQIRTATLHGKEHIVVPVVALMEGVIHAVNAKKPEFVPLHCLACAPQGWNGRPVVFGHPTRHGVQISANEPQVLQQHAFGTVFNARIQNKKLLMDAYIDPERARFVGAEAMLSKMNRGETIEVSVGAFVTTEPKEGQYGLKTYQAVWKDVVPDHLAFLPVGVGACSNEMGCGTHRAAAAGHEEVEADTAYFADFNPNPQRSLSEKVQDLIARHTVLGKGHVHTEKWHHCWEKVQEGGKDENAAAAICTSRLGDESFQNRAAGGPGSGNWGHEGRPGERGGSAPKEGGGGGGEGAGSGKKFSGFGTWDNPGKKTTTLDAIQHGIDTAEDNDYNDEQISLLNDAAEKVHKGEPLTRAERDIVSDALKQASIEADDDGEDEEAEAYREIIEDLKSERSQRTETDDELTAKAEKLRDAPEAKMWTDWRMDNRSITDPKDLQKLKEHAEKVREATHKGGRESIDAAIEKIDKQIEDARKGSRESPSGTEGRRERSEDDKAIAADREKNAPGVKFAETSDKRPYAAKTGEKETELIRNPDGSFTLTKRTYAKHADDDDKLSRKTYAAKDVPKAIGDAKRFIGDRSGKVTREKSDDSEPTQRVPLLSAWNKDSAGKHDSAVGALRRAIADPTPENIAFAHDASRSALKSTAKTNPETSGRSAPTVWHATAAEKAAAKAKRSGSVEDLKAALEAHEKASSVHKRYADTLKAPKKSWLLEARDRKIKENKEGRGPTDTVGAVTGVRGEANRRRKSKTRALASPYDTPSQIASEEAAELVGYETLRILCDQLGDTYDAVSDTVDALLEAEEGGGDNSPEGEEAETELESARLESIRTLCMAMYSSINAIIDTTSRRAVYPADVAKAYPTCCSEADVRILQGVHDNSVSLGAECSASRHLAEGENMTKLERAAAHMRAKPDSDFDGVVREYELSDDDATELRAKWKKSPRTAEGEPMDRKTVISSLTSDPHSGFTQADVKMLEAATDQRLEGFRAAAQKNKAEAQEAARKEEALRAAASSQKPLTEEDFMRVAPPRLKALLERAEKQENERKDFLVGALKTAAEGVYSEDELKAASLETLERLAKIAKVDEPIGPQDFTGVRAVPRDLSSKDDVFINPPDPYAAGLKALQEGKTH